MKLFLRWLCVCTVLYMPLFAQAESTEKPVETKAEQIDFNGETKRIVAKGNVTVTYGDTRLTADKVSVDNVTKDAFAEGNVHIYNAGSKEWHADQLQYNFKTGALNSGPTRAFSDAYYLGAGKIESQSKEFYTLRNSEFTTSEYPHPSWKWKCGSVVYYPDEKVIFRNAVLYAGDVPVFYFPYVCYDLDDIRLGADVQVGHRGSWGPFVLARYRLREDKHLWPVLKFDYRQRRGFAGGVDLDYGLGYDEHNQPGKLGSGKLETTYFNDELYRSNSLVQIPRPDRPGFQEVRINPDRYRVKLLQKFSPYEDLETTLKIDKFSDQQLLQDFFEKDLNREQYPDNFFEAQKYDENWTLNILVRPQANRFITTIERLPEISMNVPRQPIGDGFYYESETTAGMLAKRFYDDSFPDYNTMRADTFHQITYPMKYFDWLNVVPRVGARATYYKHSSDNGVGVDTALVRGVYNTGVEFSTKLHRTWPGVQNHALKIDGLRHIFEPSLNYAWVPKPNQLPQDLLQFDTGIPSGIDTQLRPIDFPQDVGIDNINVRNVFRPMIRNRWQTQRSGQPYNFLDTVIYQDLNIEGNSKRVLSNLFWAMNFYPAKWLRLSYDSQYNYYDNIIRESNVSVAYQYFKDWEVGFSHRFLHGEDTNEIWPYFKWRLNEDWAFRTEHRVNPTQGTLRESIFSIDRDLSAWVVSCSVRYLHPQTTPDDLQVWMVWTLKAFPEATVEFKQ